ncbi:MAG: RagB/SusD family nutrient uptake outer membrane protein [Bacteroidales bacterium]|nr:RagB/SusD family nutrient uptake outer membrane protein [Bacteroidales bacterium]
MKKGIISFVVSVFLLSGCTDSFLDTENHNSLDEGSFFQTENDLIIAVNAAYSPLAHPGMYGQKYMLQFTTLDDRSWFENPEGQDKLIVSLNDFSSTFDDLYRGVFRCSDILKNINRLDGVVSEDKLNYYEAQLRALRAMYYFNLVTLFHAPYFYNETNVPTDPMAYYGNSDPKQFWDQIDIDLEFATKEGYLKKSYSGSDVGRITQGAAYALWGKSRLWRHYYYYLENKLGGTAEAADNLTKAKAHFSEIINGAYGYQLQGAPDSDSPAETKQDYLNALLSNSSFIAVTGFGGKTYKAENNSESVWEVQYNGNNRSAQGWLPGWQWGGAQNFLYSGLLGYKNTEMDPEGFYIYDETEDGSAAKAAGFDRDPRAYASFYIDVAPGHDSDPMDWRDNGYNINFNSSAYSKKVVASFGLYQGDMPFGTGALMKKKYAYPQFTNDDDGTMAPNCDPYNIRVIRFADVLLMYAEACYLSGSDEAAGLAALNRVRARAGMPGVDALSEAVIIKERDMELMGEAFRFLDIVRWSRDSRWFNAINFSTKTKLGYDFLTNFTKYTTSDPNIPYRWMYMPIPQTEINKQGGNLKQNPGW